jgi:hypothetical protein
MILNMITGTHWNVITVVIAANLFPYQCFQLSVNQLVVINIKLKHLPAVVTQNHTQEAL